MIQLAVRTVRPLLGTTPWLGGYPSTDVPVQLYRTCIFTMTHIIYYTMVHSLLKSNLVLSKDKTKSDRLLKLWVHSMVFVIIVCFPWYNMYVCVNTMGPRP